MILLIRMKAAAIRAIQKDKLDLHLYELKEDTEKVA